MSGGAVHPVGTVPRDRRLGLLVPVLALPAGLLAGVGMGGVAAVAIPVVLGCALGLLGEVPLFLVLTTAVSGVGFYWVEAGFTIAGQPINLSGLHWGLILATAGVLLLRRPPARLRDLPLPLRLYGLFLFLATIALLWAPSLFDGFKQLLLFALPALVALVVLEYVERRADVRLIADAYWVALAVAVAAAIGLSAGRWIRGEGAGLVGGVGARTLAIFLLPIMSLALAGARHRSPAFLWGVAAVMVAGIATLSRTAVLVLVLLPLLATIGMRKGPRLAIVGVSLLLALGAFQVEAFRARFGTGQLRVTELSVEGQGESAALQLGSLNLSGRGWLWLHTARHAIERPVLGHGTGSATAYLAQLPGAREVHPHNDYLRVFHDQGALGLLAVLAFGVGTMLHFRRRYLRARAPLVRELCLASFLATAAYGMIALTDNPLVYGAFFTQNVFVLYALSVVAERVAREAGEVAGGPAVGVGAAEGGR